MCKSKIQEEQDNLTPHNGIKNLSLVLSMLDQSEVVLLF